ncbi:hypothetical protein FsymDg_2456 [Candidatus Protofrankia datiscae]|uniref:Uncharacterized protein n=1 Tax=Candidatus Protofrankia datiscae TaxID=2716812 RepID=F8B1F5_9ACTN|nr:hypothetical protein FsymDg_2456 [Candidatus Protofrankia datiscae]
MPALPTRQHTLLLTVTTLTTAGTGQAVAGMHAPGTTGITHHSTPRALLPTHHALPDDLFWRVPTFVDSPNYAARSVCPSNSSSNSTGVR